MIIKGLIDIISILFIPIVISIIEIIIFWYIKKEKGDFYCDLYKDSKLLNTGLCSASPSCEGCSYKSY